MAVKKRYIYEPYGYQEGENYYSIRNTLDDEVKINRQVDDNQEQAIKDINKRAFTSTNFDKDRQVVQFLNYAGDIRNELDMSDIISSILPNTLIADARYDSDTKDLVIEFENSETVRVPFGDLVDENEFGDGLEVSDGVVSVKIDDDSEAFLTVSENGIKLSGIDDAIVAAVREEFERAQKEEVDVNALLSSEVARLDNLIESEADRAKGVEGALKDSLNEEIERAETEESRIDAKLDAEIARSESKDEELETALEQEITRATDTENALRNDLDEEINRAETEESRISSELTDEINRATAAEEALDEKFTKLLQDEEDARQTQDNALNTAISTLKSDSDSADNLIRTEISEKFTQLDNKIDREKYDREEAVSTLDSKLDNEITRAKDKEDEIVALISHEEARATAQETYLDGKLSDLDTDLKDEINRAIAKDGDLETAINAEETRAKGVENGLQNDINAEVQNRVDAINEVKGSIADEIANRLSREEDFFDGVNYNKNDKKIEFLNSGNIIADIDTTDFIKDGMVESVVLNGTELVITFNTDAGADDIVIDVTGIFNPENYYNKTEVDEIADDLTQLIDDEEIRATTKETEIVSLISHEEARAKAREDEIETNAQTLISHEEARAKAAEQTIADKLQKEIDDRQDAITALKSDSDTADNLLEQKILAEKTEREAKQATNARLDDDKVNANFYNELGNKLFALDLNNLKVDGGEY